MIRAAVEAVCKGNENIRSRASQLNARAGRIVVPEVDREALVAFLIRQLRGARSFADLETIDLEALRLSPIDEELATQVDQDYPNTVELLGRTWFINYPDSSAPWVGLDDFVEGNAFLALPDEGITLPDGRTLEVRLNRERREALADTDIRALKAKVAAYLNEQAWNHWAYKNRQTKPTIRMPDPGQEGEEIAPVLEVEYGRCPLTGEPLIAYGVACAQFEDFPYFTGRWLRTAAEAEEVRLVAVQKLDSISEDAQSQRRAE